MGFNDFIKNQFIDVIEYVDSTGKTLVYKYTRKGDEIKQGAQLIVRNGQTAVFVCKGQIADVFSSGNYKLNTKNLPLLSTLAAFPYLFNSPIKSDLYFINTTQFINNKWGTKSPIIKRDPEMGVVRITAHGSFAFRVTNAELFMVEVFGARKLNLTQEIIQYIASFVSESIAQCLGEMKSSVIDLAVHYSELSSIVTTYVNEKINGLGFEISQATVESIGLPKEVEKYIDEQSGIGLASKNMNTFVQYQSARAIRDVAKQSGGIAGIGAGLAVGKEISSNINFGTPENTEQGLRSEIPDNDNSNEANESIADQLIKYKRLYDKGILTKEEYDEVKSMLLRGDYDGCY